MLDHETLTLIEKLEQHYSTDNDAMTRLALYRKGPQIARQYKVLRENPIVKKIAGEVLMRMKEASEKLQAKTAWNMTQEERILHLSSLAWGEWFLLALGEDPSVQEEALRGTIHTLAKRAGIE